MKLNRERLNLRRIIVMLLFCPLIFTGWIIPSRASTADPSTWSAVDGLGRTLPNSSTIGTTKKDKDRYVGMFYWSWHEYFSNWEPYNISNIINEYPEAANDFSHHAWGGRQSGVPHFWNEPLFGYYSSMDKYVIRKHAELLADAGVDVIFFDCTNDTLLFLDAVDVIFEVFAQAKEEGVNVPQVAFMLNINPNFMMENNKLELRQLYRTIYQKEKHKDLWFYWEGKPLVLSTAECLDSSNSLEQEILNFFIFRRSDDSFFTADTKYEDNMWGWLSVYPQTKYGVRDDGSVEQMAVGIAQNANEFGMKGDPNQKYGLTAMNDPEGTVHGRSFTEGNYSYSYKYKGKTITVDSSIENSMYYGLNFQQQWDRAIEVDPDFVFITGWNEWIAGRWDSWGHGVKNAFPDQYTDEYSRDIEPSNGPLKDYYYYQLVANIRRYKGASEITLQKEHHTIDINGDLTQWDKVAYEYAHYTGSTRERDANGYGAEHYTSNTMRNDIVSSKVAYDNDNIYFMVETLADISPSSDSAWMRLLIDTKDSTEVSENWEGFEYIVNRISPTADKAYLERSTGGWNWTSVGEVSYTVNGNVLQIAIPRQMLDMQDDVNFNFKWADNTRVDNATEDSGNILDFYQYGDVAPGGRFMYTFRSTEFVVDEPVQDTPQGSTKNSPLLPWYAILSICAAGIALVTAVLGRFFTSRKKSKN